MSDNAFVFVAPMYNAEATLPQMLHSLYGQSYTNWRLILIDDVSDPILRAGAKDWLARFDNLNAGKVTTIWNTAKLWETANVLRGISLCGDDEIVCRIDADDFLCDLDALWVIDQTYKQTGCDCLWTNHRWFDSERVTSHNLSGPLPDGVDPYQIEWRTSHLKTFRKRLINGINDQNFRGEDGEYVRRAGDQALYLPILHEAKRRVHLPMVTYAYRCDMRPQTFQTDDARFQRDEALYLRQRGFVK